jgi:hypothetical protein
MRHYYAHDAASAAREWRGAARRAALEAVAVPTLYKGSYWQQVLKLTDALGADLRVVSAGFGLLDSRDSVPPYSATFAGGSEDSVPQARSSAGRREWWRRMGGSASLRRLLRSARGPALVVLPESYLSVVEPDLAAVVGSGAPRRVLVFSTRLLPRWARVAGLRWHHVDARATRVLGVGVGALLPAVALRCAQRFGRVVSGREVERAVAGLVVDPREPLYPRREPQSEGDVREWLALELSRADSARSASAALGKFRSSGRGFERRRFHRLYSEVVARLGAPS